MLPGDRVHAMGAPVMDETPESVRSGTVSRIVGSLLIAVGFGFVCLIILMATRESPQGHLPVVLTLLGFGLLLMWVGRSFFMPQQGAGLDAKKQVGNSQLVRYRRSLGFLSITGLGLLIARVGELCAGGIRGASVILLWMLIVAAAPVVALLASRILAPAPSRDLANTISARWPPRTRSIARIILGIGRAGYIAVPFALVDLGAHVFERWHPVPQAIYFSFIALFYAYQALALFLGPIRGSTA